jgi:hypothetical protein
LLVEIELVDSNLNPHILASLNDVLGSFDIHIEKQGPKEEKERKKEENNFLVLLS